MEIWLIKNGEKAGPFPDYEIRRKIEAGEIDAESPAWHEGLPEWLPISKLAIFETEFSAPVPKPPRVRESDPDRPQVLPPSIPEKAKLGRRFWARWFDAHLFLAIWWLTLWATGRNIENIFANRWIILTQLVPWTIIEVLLIHYFATTPGKWLLGLRVLNSDGSKLNLMESTRRAFRIYVLGIGLGWFPVSIFCMGLSAFTTYRLGSPLWDHLPKHRVRSSPLSAWKIIVLVVLFFVALQSQMAVQWPYQVKEVVKQYPEMKAYFEQNQPLSLPRNHK
jgi:uncharacterized RDD family membrane protein YckC